MKKRNRYVIIMVARIMLQKLKKKNEIAVKFRVHF